jgi:hypothetical protein
VKRLCTLGCLALGMLASGCSAASTARSAEGSGTGAVSSPSVGAAVKSLPVTTTEFGVSSSPASPAPTAQLSRPCGTFGLRIDALPVGDPVEHTEQDALRAAAAANVGPTSHVRVYAAWVQDPTADKVGLGDSTQFRVTWVLDGTNTIATPSPGTAHFPPSSDGAPTPGSVYRTITLVDDHSLMLGGNFDCGGTQTISSPDSALPATPSASSSPSPACSGFALSLASDRGGQSSPIEAAIWFAQHGSVQGIPKTGWKEVGTGNAQATVQSEGVQLHVLEGPHHTWQVASASTNALDVTTAIGLTECASTRQKRVFVSGRDDVMASAPSVSFGFVRPTRSWLFGGCPTYSQPVGGQIR